MLTGSGTVAPLGTVQLSGDLGTQGFILRAGGLTQGTVTLTSGQGSITLDLVGTLQPPNATPPVSGFQYTIVGGTGAFAGVTGSGLITLTETVMIQSNPLPGTGAILRNGAQTGGGQFTMTFNPSGTAATSPTTTSPTTTTSNQAILRSDPSGETGTSTSAEVSTAFGPGGALTLVTGSDGSLKEMDSTGEHLLIPSGVRSASVAFSPSGNVVFLVTASDGALIQFTNTGSQVLLPSGVQSATVTFTPSTVVFLITSTDGSLRQFDNTGGTLLISSGVQSAQAIYNANIGSIVILVTSSDGSLRQFDRTGGTLLVGSGVKEAEVTVNPTSGTVILVTSDDGSLRQFDSSGGQVLESSGVQSASVAFGPDGTEVKDIIFSDGTWEHSDANGTENLGMV